MSRERMTQGMTRRPLRYARSFHRLPKRSLHDRLVQMMPSSNTKRVDEHPLRGEEIVPSPLVLHVRIFPHQAWRGTTRLGQRCSSVLVSLPSTCGDLAPLEVD